MSKEIKLEFEKGGVVTASLLEKEAPETCKVVWEKLPVEANVLHAILAGQEILFDFPMPHELLPENETNRVEPGYLMAAVPANARVEGKNTLTEGCFTFCIFYGIGRPRKFGPGGTGDQTMDLNLFGVCNNLDILQTVGKRIRVYGTEKVKASQVP